MCMLEIEAQKLGISYSQWVLLVREPIPNREVLLSDTVCVEGLITIL